MMNKAQADIAYGFTAIARRDPAYYAFWLMNNVFGQYAIGGRLGDSIRERQGMAYYVSSSLDANIVGGAVVDSRRRQPGATSIGRSRRLTKRSSASCAMASRRKSWTTRDGISSGPSRARWKRTPRIANFLQTEEVFGLGLDYDARLPDLLTAVTLDEVNAAARRVLDPDRATVVVAGPYDGPAGIG